MITPQQPFLSLRGVPQRLSQCSARSWPAESGCSG
jgi:hypothetical protein